jgi:hypothetical protein
VNKHLCLTIYNKEVIDYAKYRLTKIDFKTQYMSSNSQPQLTLQTHPQWIDDKISEKISYYISRYNEVPKSILMLASNWHNDNHIHTLSMLPDRSNIIYKAKNAFIDFSSVVNKLFEHYEKVNIFDLYHTNGYTSLPLVLDLFEENRLGTYTPVTATTDMARNAIDSIREILTLSTLAKRKSEFRSDMINVDIERGEFASLVKDVMNEYKADYSKQVNVYTLGENTLGNMTNPEWFLQNIYSSMQKGEKLVIMQAIYRKGAEDALVDDYTKLYPELTKTRQLANHIAPENSPLINFDETIGGITIDIQLHTPSKVSYLELEENRTVRIFRSTRFKIEDLHRMFKNIGFAVNLIVFDDTGDNAVILLSK